MERLEPIIKIEPEDDEVIVIKEEVLSDDEQNEYCEYVNSSEMPDIEIGNNSLTNSVNFEENIALSDLTSGQYYLVCNDEEDIPTLLYLVNQKEEEKKRNEERGVTDNDSKATGSGKFLSKKTVTEPLKMTPKETHKFKCSECDETFELKSVLVMHELGHEKYKKYSQWQTNSTAKNSQLMHICEKCNAAFKTDSQLAEHTKKQHVGAKCFYKCKYCSAAFEVKNRLRSHEFAHTSQQKQVCNCKTTSDIISDLCRCFVRTCDTCGTKFYAVLKFANWNICMKCFLRKQQTDAYESSQRLNINGQSYPAPTFRKYNNLTERRYEKIRSVKRACYSCGKKNTDVMGSLSDQPWLCYECSYTGKQSKQSKCVYCSCLFPSQSLNRNHKCLHKPIHLTNKEDKVGNHFMASSLSEQKPTSDWEKFFRDADISESDDEQTDFMVVDTTPDSDDDDDGSETPTVMLCDKTGKLIDLNLSENNDK